MKARDQAPFRAESVVRHGTFITIAGSDLITDVTEYGSLIAGYRVRIRDGMRLAGYVEVFSDCPGEV